jgi:CheY-like chemotaxis protein/nitrogen-specific signal transduction histidine kinase
MLGQIEKRETELREARDGANRANQAKSNFLSFMSHELRTPLTSIIGFSEVLAAELKSENKTNWADDLRRINDSGKYLLELINDILDLSKIEAGKMEVHLETFRIGHLVADAADVLRPLIEQKSNRLVVDCAEDLGAMQADRIKVRQCLLNLLSNANKFTERGTVTLCARRKQRHGEERIIVSVTDTGIGMTTEQMGKLFRPFTQADSSTARKHGGTGLGLALTKQFCQIMGGNVGVTSEPGVGSTFTIDLPAESGRSKGSGPTPTPTPLVGQPRRGDTKIIAKRPCLLVIDDDPATHKMLGETLKPDGYELVFPVAITLDVMMPDMDGWVVLSLLKSDPDLAAIPVIMLTVCAEQDFAFAMGVADYLKKPIDAERLTAVLEKHRPQHPPVEVLVVEDDPAMRDMIRRILEKQHWSVSEASNGKAALERISQAVPSLIILDVMMPIMDGFQMMAELQKKEEWRKIPVVVVSAKDLTAEDRARLQSNVKIVLQKGSPVRHQLMREVQETVRTFLPS